MDVKLAPGATYWAGLYVPLLVPNSAIEDQLTGLGLVDIAWGDKDDPPEDAAHPMPLAARDVAKTSDADTIVRAHYPASSPPATATVPTYAESAIAWMVEDVPKGAPSTPTPSTPTPSTPTPSTPSTPSTPTPSTATPSTPSTPSTPTPSTAGPSVGTIVTVLGALAVLALLAWAARDDNEDEDERPRVRA